MRAKFVWFGFLVLLFGFSTKKNSKQPKIKDLEKKIVQNGETYTLFASKIINPEKTMVFEKYNINKVVKIPVVSIGLYYEHSIFVECCLILIRIDAKVAPHKKVVNALQKRLGLYVEANSETEIGCGKIYDGELSIYRNKIESSLSNLLKSDLGNGDQIFIKICPTKIHISIQRIFSDEKERKKEKEGEFGFEVEINNKLYCQIKKNMENLFL